MVVELGLLVLAVGLSLLAGYLLQKKQKNLAIDDKPTTLATRGSYLPLVKGRRRIGSIFGYAGNRQTKKEKAGGGKGSSLSPTPKVNVFFEDGWHQLCVGPVWALHEIEQGGNIIFSGPITAESHPSGSLIDLGSEGSFRIFWGENDQPVNSYLGDASRVGIASRWPGCCYIEWREKRLGQSPMWPTLTYVVETRPQTAHLTNSTGYIPPTRVLHPTDTYPIVGRVTGSKGTAYWELVGDQMPRFKPGQQIQVTGNTGLGVDTDYTILSVVYTGVGTNRTRLFTNETIVASATANGNLKPYDALADDGWNPAHMFAELLFEQWPVGLGLDKAEWDMQSLEDLGVLLSPANENLRGSLLAQDGQDVRGLIGALMQDLGVLLPIDMTSGLLRFQPVRKPTGTIPFITEDAMVQRPEIETVLAERPVDRIVFTFSSEDNAFRDMTIAVDEDGQASRQDYYRARTVQIVSTTHFDTAARISERRSFEELAGAAEIRLQLGRAARTLLPGQAIAAAGFDEVLRVTQTKHDPLSGQVDVTVLSDFYGAPLSDFVTNRANTGAGGQPVEQDEVFAIVELPEVLVGAGGPQTVMVAHVRAHSTVTSHDLHISRDNTTYTFAGNDISIMGGGTLTQDLDSAMEQAQGPTFDALGPDVSSTLDLSADLVSWRGGRQLVVFVDGTEKQEFCFLKKVTALGGSSYRLDGLIRGRYDTRPLTIPAGSKFFIVQNDDGLPIQDPLLEPQVLLYAKSQPRGQGAVPLPNIAPATLQLYGKGIRPVPVSGLRLDTGSGSAGAGNTRWTDVTYRVTGAAPDDDLVVRWSYSTPRTAGTGAGTFGWGSLVADAAPEGDFLVEILDATNVVRRTETVTAAMFTYTRANRLTDFGVEPTTFKVRVTQLRGGYSADPVVQEFTKAA